MKTGHFDIQCIYPYHIHDGNECVSVGGNIFVIVVAGRIFFFIKEIIIVAMNDEDDDGGDDAHFY